MPDTSPDPDRDAPTDHVLRAVHGPLGAAVAAAAARRRRRRWDRGRTPVVRLVPWIAVLVVAALLARALLRRGAVRAIEPVAVPAPRAGGPDEVAAAGAGPGTGDLLSREAALETLGVDPAQFDVMVRDGMVTSVDTGSGAQFHRGELDARRLLGG